MSDLIYLIAKFKSPGYGKNFLDFEFTSSDNLFQKGKVDIYE